MALDEINEYPVTATEIADGSFMDIDQYDGVSAYESQKVPKSVLQAFVSANNENFANTDLTIVSTRTQTLNTLGSFTIAESLFTAGSYLFLGGSTNSDNYGVLGHGTNYFVVDDSNIQFYFGAAERMRINASQICFNESGADVDFRVEGDTDANLLFTDASTDFVGVGTNLPQAKVDIHAQGSLSTDVVFNVRNSADTADILSINGDGSFIGLPCEFQLAVSDETTNLTTGTAKITFRMPYAMTLTDIRASVTTAPTGSTISVGVNQSGTTILSTDLSIDISEKTSTTAAVPPVISTSALIDDGEITIDIDQIGSTIAGTGLKVTLIGTRA